MGYEKGHRIVKKWFQPYVILETVKKYFEVEDITFTGMNKFDAMEEFLTKINTSSKMTVGLYMKNVNKFYILTIKDGIDVLSVEFALENLLFKNGFDSQKTTDFKEWVEIEYDTDKALSLVDMGKAEASFVVKQDW